MLYPDDDDDDNLFMDRSIRTLRVISEGFEKNRKLKIHKKSCN